MDGWLKALVAAASLVIVIGGGYYGWSEYNRYQERQKLQERARLARLTDEACYRMAQATIPTQAGQPAKTMVHAADLKSCSDLGKLAAYEEHQLKLSGVIK